VTELGNALVANDWNAIHTGCAKLAEATPVMYDALPTPDERLTAAFEGALDNFNAATSECPSLDANSDRVDTFAFTASIDRAMDHLNVVREIMG
jgi:hypothetical protein